MSCKAKSLYGWNVMLLAPVIAAFPVVWFTAWQAWQPIFVNTCCPRDTDAVDEVEVVEVDEFVDVEVVDVEEVEDAAATCVPDADCAAAVLELAGVGGANMRMKAAKSMMSCEKPAAGLAPLVVSVRFVVLSGKLLNWQFGSFSRSFGKASLVTPCSTL